MKYLQKYLVRGQEVDMDKLVMNKPMVEMLSEITMMHGWEAGHTSTEGVSPVSWMVLGWKMQVSRRLKMFDIAHVETWISKYDRVKAYRDYLIKDSEGNECAKASAVWVAMDGQKGTFKRLSPELMDVFEPGPDVSNFPDYKYEQLSKVASALKIQKTMKFRVINQMLDYNGHVHNSEYINIADQIIPKDVERGDLNNIEVFYKQQILPDEMVMLGYAYDEGKHYVVVRDTESDALHAVVVQS